MTAETRTEAGGRAEPAAGPSAPATGSLRILEPGPMALVEDLGRPGFAAIGAGRSGAVDRAALRLGNRIVGNQESAAGLEILIGSFSVRFERTGWFAVTGARGVMTLDGVPVEPDTAQKAASGQTLSIAPASRGLRYYLAVRGGVDVEPQLGSRSRDVLTGLGPEPLQAGDGVRIGPAPCTEIPAVDLLTVSAPPDGPVTIMVTGGPRASWFSAQSIDAFYDTEWMVSPESNRIGARLMATSHAKSPVATIFERIIERELPSEAMIAGAIQVPPSGIPTVLLADHPVTGGYPVIAVVADASLDAFGQLRPGQTVTFRHAH